MASQKISELTDGSPAQVGDEIPVARAGANRRITVADISSMPMIQLNGTLTSAQLKALFTTPVQILADVAGITILPKYFWLRKQAGTAYTLNGGTHLQVNFGAASGSIHAFKITAANTFDQAAEKKSLWQGISGDVFNVGFDGSQVLSGQGLRFLVPTANWTLGTGDVIWQLHYHKLIET